MTAPDHPGQGEPPSELPDPDDVPAVSAERLVDGHDAHVGEPEARRYPSTVGGMVYLLVLAMAIAGVAVAASGSWRGGVRLIGAALLVAATARALLPTLEAGMLAVRHRAVDVSVLTALGAALLVLASSIPNQPG
ncbi:DUF3017 domain-containing protein [Nocardioides sp.]|uniref:DUF3017 domain-containing protein n=1 Tax=Nocardioides sp. TaxID=35761 RepID=UPI003529937D